MQQFRAQCRPAEEVGNLVAPVTQRLDGFQGQCTTPTHYDATYRTQTAHDCLVISDGAQRGRPCQLYARAGEATGTSTIGEQQTTISNLATALQLNGMLTCPYTYHAVR